MATFNSFALIFILSLATFLLPAKGEGCSDTLRLAQEDYEMGRLELVRERLKICMKQGFTPEQLRDAYVLLVKCGIGMDQLDWAREQVRELILHFPDFTAGSGDPPLLKKWLTELKVHGDEGTLFFKVAQGTVVSASQVEETAAQAPATIYVVDASQIRDRGYRHLKDLLEDIPEVEIQTKSVAEFNNYYTFRGISGNEKFIILLNGFRFNSPTGTPHVIENNYPLVNIERVEVILGPASALYGADAFGGIVNMITASGDKLNGGEFTLGGGDFGTGAGSLVYGREMGRFNFSISGHFYQSDEPDFSKIHPDAFSWYNEHYVPNGEMRTGFGESNADTVILPPSKQGLAFETPTEASFLHLGIKTGNYEFGFASTSESHSSSVSGKPEYYLFTDDAIFHSVISSIYGRHQFHGVNWTLRSSFWRGAYETRSDSAYINVFTSFEKGYKYGDNRTVKVEEQLVYRLGFKSSIIFGLSYEEVSALPKTGDLPREFNKGQAAESRNQELYYLGTNVTAHPGTDREEDLILYQLFHNLSYKNKAAYLQYQRQSSLLNLTLGGRLDTSSRYGSTFNPRASLVFTPKERMNVKLLYGEAFLAPSPWVAYQQFGSFVPVDEEGAPVPIDAQGNPLTEQVVDHLEAPFWHLPSNQELDPEKLRSWELAFAWYLSANFSLQVDYYHSRIEDRIENVLFTRLTDAGSGLSYDPGLSFLGVPVDVAERPANVGALTSYGGTLRLEGLFQVKALEMAGRFAWSVSDGDLNGGVLPYSAKNTVKAGLEMKYGNWTVAPGLLYRSASFREDGAGNSSFTLLNLFSRYDLSLSGDRFKLSAFIRVDNLLDEDYRNVSFAGSEGFTATLQDPRRIAGGLTVSF